MTAPETHGRLSARELARAAMATASELTGFQPEATTRLEWEEDVWCIEVDVLELPRIPSTTDVLGRYEVKLDPSGTLRGYRRLARFTRGAPNQGE